MKTKLAKLNDKLTEKEAQLRGLLIPALRSVIAGTDTLLFVTKHNNPWPELKYHTSQTGADILELADEIIALARRHRVDTNDLLAARVKRSFLAANDLDNHHRPGPLRLAEKLLQDTFLPGPRHDDV
jgi:hypothetical protein